MDQAAVQKTSRHDLFCALTDGIARHCPDIVADSARMQTSALYFRQMLDLAVSTGEPELVAVVRELRARGVILAPLGQPGLASGTQQRINPDIEQTRAALSVDAGRPSMNTFAEAAKGKLSRWVLGGASGALLLALVSVWWAFQVPVETVAGEVRGRVHWTNDRFWRLEGIVHVVPGATLTIEPGTTILGAAGSALIVTRGATIDARGSVGRPIVFTSALAEGARARGDWGGIVLMGSAPVNQRATHLEGIPETDTRGHFGGRNADGSCGALQFVRIEFAGRETYPDRELNGLTLAGCGSSTVVDHVQVHKPLDDGIEIFGGAVSLRNIVITDPGDDGLDYDLGWRGRIQYLAIKMYPGVGDNAIEGDNNARFPVMTPASSPTIYNATLIGTGAVDERHHAMTLRSGTEGEFGNVLMAGFVKRAVVLQGDDTLDNIMDGSLRFRSSVVDQAGVANGDTFQFLHDTRPQSVTVPSPVKEPAVRRELSSKGDFTDEKLHQALLAEGGLAFADGALAGNALSTLMPSFATGDATIQGAELPRGEFWDRRAHFVGVGERSEPLQWWSGWTAFPEH